MEQLNFVEPIRDADKLNFLGLGDSYSETDALEKAKRLSEARAKYPIDKLTTCESVAVMIEQCAADLDRVEKIRAAGGSITDRVIAREQIAWETRLSELKQWQSGQQCAIKLEAQQQNEFYDTQFTQLQRVKSLSDGTAKSSTYLVYGMIAVFVIVAGVIIVKKLKKS
jgi:hypothetical protein